MFKIRPNYEFDIEPGNDYIVDKHGNIIYGEGYVGAYILPKSGGINTRDFLEFYFTINEVICKSLLQSLSREFLKVKEVEYIVTILRKHVNNELEKNMVTTELENFAKECVPRVGEDAQLSYYKMLKDHFMLVLKQECKIPCYYCVENYSVFQTGCCFEKKYMCKSCLHQNYKGMKQDKHHVVYCPFCDKKPYIQLVK